MLKIPTIITIIFIINTTKLDGALLFWSKTPFEVSPLIDFNDNDLEELKMKMGNPMVQIYKISTPLSWSDFKQILQGYYSQYNANGDLNNLENVTEIFNDLTQIDQQQNEKILSIVLLSNQRYRRDIVENFDTDSVPTMITINSGPVLYKAKDKNDESTYIIMYSTQPLLLKVNDDNYLIGNTSEEMITIDNRPGSFVKFSVKVPSDDLGKVTLNFLFIWYGNYWQINSVKITDMNNNYNFNLTLDNINNNLIPAHFSYHCSGYTIFSNDNKNNNDSVELYIKDIQVQIDGKMGKFSDAYDCVPFTTVRIWSGLMVAMIIGIVLIIGITAMLDIKTMDKFDNYKTKQLTIIYVVE